MKEKVKDLDPVKFVVGSRPEWTEELIKQLPHGTTLSCAFKPEDIYIYSGQPFLNQSYTGFWLDTDPTRICLYWPPEKRYAEIVSLPKKITDRINNYFENTNPEQLKKDWEETKEPEFQPGEIVDEYRGGEVYQPVIYRFFADGVHWVSKARADKAVFIPEEIRKIQPDPEKEIKKIAEQIKSTGSYRYQMNGDRRWILEEDVDFWLIEALKTEVK